MGRDVDFDGLNPASDRTDAGHPPEFVPVSGSQVGGRLESVGPIQLWRCSSCAYRTRDYADGRCPCDIPQPDGSDVECRGTLCVVPVWCSIGQHLVSSLAVESGRYGSECHDCHDARMDRTVRIPVESLADIAAQWRAEQMAEVAS